MYRYCYSLTADEDDAYDLLQDAVERLLRAKPALDSTSYENYARRIIKNRFIDRYRQQRREQENPLTIIDESDPGLELIQLEDQQELEQIWPLLDPLDREILYFWAYEDCSTSDIATKMQLPKGTILSRMHRLKRKIKRDFEQQQRPTNHDRFPQKCH